MKFRDIKFDSDLDGDFERKWARVDLDNGMNVSIVQNKQSCGGNEGLYEMGVFRGGRMIEVEKWQDSIIGWCSPAEIEKELKHLKELD